VLKTVAFKKGRKITAEVKKCVRKVYPRFVGIFRVKYRAYRGKRTRTIRVCFRIVRANVGAKLTYRSIVVLRKIARSSVPSVAYIIRRAISGGRVTANLKYAVKGFAKRVYNIKVGPTIVKVFRHGGQTCKLVCRDA
jgi:hypothetical protein